MKTNYICIDVETTGLEYKKDTITSFCIYNSENEEFLSESNLPSTATHNDYIVSLNMYIRRYIDSHIFIFHNAKFDLHMMDISPEIVDRMSIIDTTILAQYVDPRGSNKLGDLETKYFETNTKQTYLDKYGKDFNKWPSDILSEYNRKDVEITYLLAILLQPRVPTKFYLYQEKLLKALYRIEYNGFPFDAVRAEEVEKEFTKQYIQSLGDIHSWLSEYLEINGMQLDINTINFNSSKQVSKLLYETLEIEKPDRNNFPRGKAYDRIFTSTMTGKELLRTIKHPFIDLYLTSKEYKSTLTFIETYKSLSIESRLYPSFNITGTITGRLSCSRPNLQNIKKAKGDKFSPRSLFIPEIGEQLVSIDYQQQEIRMLAILSKDKNLLELVNRGIDMHLAVAQKMYGREVTKEERDVFKALHFAMLYGLSPDAMAFNMSLPVEEIYTLLDDYYNQFPRVKEWMDEIVSETEFTGELTLFTGRKWYTLPYAAYQGINAMIQGSSAEVTNMACIRLNNYFKENKVGRILSIIHDEFLFSLSDISCIPDLVKIMENEKLFGYKFLVDVEISESY